MCRLDYRPRTGRRQTRRAVGISGKTGGVGAGRGIEDSGVFKGKVDLSFEIKKLLFFKNICKLKTQVHQGGVIHQRSDPNRSCADTLYNIVAQIAKLQLHLWILILRLLLKVDRHLIFFYKAKALFMHSLDFIIM
jgi:hypothetical protein